MVHHRERFFYRRGCEVGQEQIECCLILQGVSGSRLVAFFELHSTDVIWHIHKVQLKKRNETGGDDPLQDEATFDLLLTYFTPPTVEELFTVVHHANA